MAKEGSVSKKGNRKIMVALIVVLVLAFGYIGYDNYIEWKAEGDILIYQQGANYGYEQAVIGVANGVISCQELPLRVGNDTINVVWTECLKTAA